MTQYSASFSGIQATEQCRQPEEALTATSTNPNTDRQTAGRLETGRQPQ
jgi:hypothetical protein